MPGAKAKFAGALMSEPDVDHELESSSAMNASLNFCPTYSGYSSERKRKSIERQLASAGTFRSIFRIVTSKSLSPRTLPPPSAADWSSSGPGSSGTFVFGFEAAVASPVERIA